MTTVTVLKFENIDYKPEINTEVIEQFNPVSLQFEKITQETVKPLTDDEITAAKRNENYRLANVAVDILNRLGCTVILELNKIKFYTEDKGE